LHEGGEELLNAGEDRTDVAHLGYLVDTLGCEFDLLQVHNRVIIIEFHAKKCFYVVFEGIEISKDVSTEFFTFFFKFVSDPIDLHEVTLLFIIINLVDKVFRVVEEDL